MEIELVPSRSVGLPAALSRTRGLRPAHAEIGSGDYVTSAGIGWCTTELRSCEGSETKVSSRPRFARRTDDFVILCSRPSTVAIRTTCSGTLCRKPTVCSLYRSPAGMIPPESTQGAYIARGMPVPLTFYRHSAFFGVFEGVSLTNTMGAAFEIPIFDTLVSRNFRRLPANRASAHFGPFCNGRFHSELPD